MADKRRVKKSIRNLQRIKTWQLVVLLILAGFIAATFLRMNNVGMIQRREAVHAADKAGNTDQTKARLYDLQRYAAAHMNASTGPVYLQDQYDRDSKAALEAATDTRSGSNSYNAQAEAVCKPQFQGYSSAYLECFMNELSKHPTSDKITEPQLPSPALYKYDFASPVWSPDFAGWSVVACVAILLLIVARVTSVLLLKAMLKRHYRGV